MMMQNFIVSEDTAQDPPFLEFKAVSKQYGDFTALNHISLSLNRGEILGYIGPNGAGKTTTMKIIVGLIRSFEGKIVLKGVPLTKREDNLNHMLGYLPQDVGFQNWRTVYHMLDTFGRLSGYDPGKLPQRIEEVLKLVGLADVGKKKIVHLSGGMQQKLRLAQALLHEPEFLVLDEPMTGLDPTSRYQMKNIIRSLAKEGITIFLSSHILSDIQDIADRIAILNRGEILNVGTPQQLQAKFHVGHAIEVVFSEIHPDRPDLSKFPHVAKVEYKNDTRAVLTLNPDLDLDEALQQILGELAAHKCVIRNFNLLQPSLEDVYLRYVEGGA